MADKRFFLLRGKVKGIHGDTAVYLADELLAEAVGVQVVLELVEVTSEELFER